MASSKFVRLREGVTIQADLDSGWSISGLDVVEVPGDENPLAQEFVKTKLREGILENASRAEFEEVEKREGSGEPPVVTTTTSGTHQEQDLRDKATAARQKVTGKRTPAKEESGEEPKDSDEG